MILTCPSCASRYFVDDAKLGPAGKKVRCAACGAQWLAVAEEPLDLGLAAEPVGDPAPVAEEASPQEPAPKDPAKGFRDKVRAEKLDRDARTTGVIWAGMAALVLLLAAGAVLFRGGVVEMWPRTAGAYASIGLPVNRIGLEIEKIRAEPILLEGRAALQITGGLRNVTGKTVTSPNIEITLANPAGKVVAGKLVAPSDPQIPAGQVRFFTVTLLDPPSTAQDLIIGFANGAGGKAEKLKAPVLAAATVPDLRPASQPDPLSDTAIGVPAAVEPVTPTK